jgi:hypothetical protein
MRERAPGGVDDPRRDRPRQIVPAAVIRGQLFVSPPAQATEVAVADGGVDGADRLVSQPRDRTTTVRSTAAP